jgi:MFS family permease
MGSGGNTLSAQPPPPRFYRWLVLLSVSLAMFASYYVFDALAPVSQFLTGSLGFSEAQYGALLTAYNTGALLALLAAGPVIDRIGAKRAALLFGVLATAAGTLTAFSSDYRLMWASRCLLGIGCEPLCVAVTTALARWFKGKELSFAFGVSLLIARLGSVAADRSPTLAGPLFTGWQPPLLLAACVGLLCTVAGFLYLVLESRAERVYSLGEEGAKDRLSLKDLAGFGRSYWLVVALCLTFYSAIFPFRSFAFKFFTECRGTSLEEAGRLNSFLPWMAMFATPLFGLLADRVGRRATLLMAGSVLLLPVYLLMAYSDLSLYLPVIALGLVFSLIPAILWPSVAYIVEARRLGTAYALMTLLQQVGWGAMNWVIGWSNGHFQAGAANPAGYRPGMWIFSCLGLLGLLFALLLRRSETGPQAHGLETVRTRKS